MQIPLQIVADGLELGGTELGMIRSHAEKLERFFGRVLGCTVTVTVPNRWPQDGPKMYGVRIDLTVPGEELVIHRQPNEHLQDALQKAFRVAGRRLQDYARRLSPTSPPKAHAEPECGRVIRIFPGEGYGFLEGSDGREIYFHRNSVRLDGFDRLEVGTQVRFAEEEGNEGPQASTLEIVRAQRHRRSRLAREA